MFELVEKDARDMFSLPTGYAQLARGGEMKMGKWNSLITSW